MPTPDESPIRDRFHEWRSRPVSVTEAADAVAADLTPAERAALRACPHARLRRFDFTLGVLIRNRLGLWNGGRLTEDDGSLVTCPDAAAQLVIEELWLRERWQEGATKPAAGADGTPAMTGTLGTGLHICRTAKPS